MAEVRAQQCCIVEAKTPQLVQHGITKAVITDETLNHLLGVEYKQLIDTTGKIKECIAGFHHDYLNEMENKGLIKLLNKRICPETGYIKAHLEYNGIVVKNKTFFPPHWTRKEVIEFIKGQINAENAVIRHEHGVLVIESATSEKVIIRAVLNADHSVKTVYPLLKHLEN